MRKVRVPVPHAAWELRCEGPTGPAAPSAAVARSRLESALAALPRMDARLGDDGWTVVWSSTILEAGPLLKLWLWTDRAEQGAALQRATAKHLEEAGFLVRRGARPVTPDAAMAPRVVYLRSGPFRLGLEPRTSSLFAQVEVVSEERVNIDLGQRFKHRQQPCPGCGAVDHPSALVAGFPSPELLLAAELGEVAFAAGGVVDRRSKVDARCRSCGADFIAR